MTINHGGIANQTLTLPTVAARRLAMVYDQPACTDTGGSSYGTGGWNFGTVCPPNTNDVVQMGFTNPTGSSVTFTFQLLNNSNSVFKFSDGTTGAHTCVAAAHGSCSTSLEVLGSGSGTMVGANMTGTLQVSAPGFSTSTYPLEATVAPMAKATLLLDDATIAAETSGSADSTIKVQVKHPYVNTNFNDASPLSYPVARGGIYVFASEFGGSQSGQALSRTQKRLAGMLAGSISATSQQETIETLNVIGQTWLRETTLNTALGAWATNTRYTVHHRIGLVGQNTSFYVDIRNQTGTVTGYSGTVGTGLMTKICGLVPSSLEHGVLEQLQYGASAVSTVKILEIANNTGTQKIFMANSSNFATVQPQLSGYSSNNLSNFSSAVSSGYVLFLPQQGNNQLNQWKGEGYIEYYDSGNYSSIMMAIGGGYNGGFETFNNTTTSASSTNTNSISSITQPATITSNPSTDEPIDLVTGAYTLDHTDLKLGSAAPLGLALGRSYSSQNSSQQTSTGNGWRHDYDISLSTYSDGQAPLGLRRHMDAAPAIVAALVIADLMQDIAGTDPATAQKWLAGALTAKWLTDNLLNHSVSIYYGEKVMTFTQLPNGTYISPPGITSTLVCPGGVYKLQNRDGSTLAFTNVGTNDYRASTLTDANGNVMNFTYNGTLLSKVTDAFGRTLTFTYTGSLVSSVLDSYGRTVKYGYTSGNLTSYTDADNNLWQYGYGAGLGLLTTLTDPLSQTYITNTYDSQGKATKQVALRQNNQTATYKAFVNDYRSEEFGPYGDAAVYFYDRKSRTVMTGRSLSGSTNVNNRTSMVYDGQDHATQTTDPIGNITNFTFDANNNLLKITDPLNNVTTNNYETSLFRLTKVTGPLTHYTDFAYTDSAHPYSMTQTTTHPTTGLSIATSAAYTGPKGLVSSIIDGRNSTTGLNYTLSGSWISGISSTAGSHPAVQKTFDQVGRMTQLVDQKGSIYKLGYNNRDLVTTATDPFNKVKNSYYRTDGRLDHVIDRTGNTTTFGYTPSGKVQSITYPGSLNVGLTYDLDDKLTNITDSFGGTGTTYGYDGYSRLNFVTDAQGATVGYSYDSASNLKVITYPDRKTVTYTYDAFNRMKTVSIDWLSETATYYYDNAGRLYGLAHFNGSSVNWGYDNANRLTSLSNTTTGGATITGYAYTLDNNGNRHVINATGALPPANVAQNISYTYTSTGNRLSNLGSTALIYDSEGQLKSEGSTNYTFDGAHRLTAYEASSFSYDGANHRLKATRAGVAKQYVYDASGNLLVEEDGSGKILKYFIYGKGLLAWYDATAGVLYCYHFDGNGNTVAVTDTNQKIVNKYSYSPYGAVEGRFELKPQPFTYVGQFGVFDEGSGIYYMRARYYDANAKRFISEDSLGFDGGQVNLYAYVSNNPIMSIDPLGLCGLEAPNAFLDPVNYLGGFLGGAVKGLFAGAATSVSAEIGEVLTNDLLESGLNISAHAAERMAERGITEKMVQTAINQGTAYWDPKNQVINYVLEGGFASGKSLLVGQAPSTGLITTVIRGSKLINSRFIPM